jgi:hypothetical protein
MLNEKDAISIHSWLASELLGARLRPSKKVLKSFLLWLVHEVKKDQELFSYLKKITHEKST